MKSLSLTRFLGFTIPLLVCLSLARAEVESVTLGIRVHCPYGIIGCWPEIRDGLQHLEGYQVLDKYPDRKTDTCQVKSLEGRLTDPNVFAHNFTNMHIGVDVRGVEVVVNGSVELRGTNALLRVSKSDQVFQLAPLSHKVQWDPKHKQPDPASPEELKAFETLLAVRKNRSGQIQVTGPLIKEQPTNSHAANLILEVRTFHLPD